LTIVFNFASLTKSFTANGEPYQLLRPFLTLTIILSPVISVAINPWYQVATDM